MIDDEARNALAAEIDDLYEHVLLRPAMFAGRSHQVESFINGVECVLNMVCGKPPRTDQYREFLGVAQFGARNFTATFEDDHGVYRELVPIPSNEEIKVMRAKEEKFEAAFKEHFRAFLDWRKRQRQA